MLTELDPRMVFDRFIVGPANRLAATAARRTAESPGTSYNPLFISGPPGVGKTHLLTAIGHLARAVEPDLYVHFESVDTFIDRLTVAITDGTVDEFRKATGQSGLFLLDDLQHVAGAARTQEELLLTFDVMLEQGGQVVIAADRPPHEIPALDDRLSARLAGGLIVDMSPPESDTRLAILAQMLEDRGTKLRPDLVQAVGRLPMESVADLRDAMERVLEAVDAGNAPEPDEVEALVGLGRTEAAARMDSEFGQFLSDISTAVAAVVETAPWRRRIAQAILRWEGEGIRTRRLEAALDADSAPDVDGLLATFARDVARLREVGREMPMPPGDPLLLTDPDRLAEAEDLLVKSRAATRPPRPAPAPAPVAAGSPKTAADPWFLDREKLAWSWLALEDRIVEDPG
jgi:hypothetical protein